MIISILIGAILLFGALFILFWPSVQQFGVKQSLITLAISILFTTAIVTGVFLIVIGLSA